LQDFSGYSVFYILHLFHVVLSTLVTTAMYKLHTQGKLWNAISIGYTGSIATVSDVIISYLGACMLRIDMLFIVPFVTKWWINLFAFTGIVIGCLRPTSGFLMQDMCCLVYGHHFSILPSLEFT